MMKPTSTPLLVVALLAVASLSAQNCLSDNLNLDSDVQCHPASRYLKLQFDIFDAPVEGSVIFQAYIDSTWVGNVWMEPTGSLLVHENLVGQQVTLCQFGEENCCREFSIPACSDVVCPLEDARDAIALDCNNGMIHYQFDLRHHPPIDMLTTDFGIYNEDMDYLAMASLADQDSIVDIFVPASGSDRLYTVCDLYEGMNCCISFNLPAVPCEELVMGVRDLADLGIAMYPNPVQDHLILDLGDWSPGNQGLRYRIFDSTGKPMDAGMITEPVMTLPASQYPAGMLMVGLYEGNELLGYRRIVKLH